MGSRSLLAILSTRPFGGFFFGVIMLKKYFLALALMAGMSSAHAAGTINYSLSQQFDQYGKVLAGCKFYLFAAGTTTPQVAYQDSALTIPSPGGSQLTCDAAGRLPQFFLADGSVKIRLTDKFGVNQVTADGILVIGPSGGGGGGGGSVDPTTIIATGDIKARYGTGVLTGFVRANGRTIGSATSGATERANADAQPLFEYLWNADPSLAVSTGRGGSSNADWVANKTIVLPDWRGRNIAGLADMGNTDSGVLPLSFYGTSSIVLGAAGGGASQILLPANLPSFTPSGTIAVTNGTITAQVAGAAPLWGSGTVGAGGGGTATVSNLGAPQITQGLTTASFTGNNNGGTSSNFSVMNPSKLTTIYVKL